MGAAAEARGWPFRPLDEASLVEYIRATPVIRGLLEGGSENGELSIKEVGDGNLNFVYIVIGPCGSVVIKQVLPPLLRVRVLVLVSQLFLPRFFQSLNLSCHYLLLPTVLYHASYCVSFHWLALLLYLYFLSYNQALGSKHGGIRGLV